MATAAHPSDDILKKGVGLFHFHYDLSGNQLDDFSQINKIPSDWELDSKRLSGYESGEEKEFMSIIPKKVTRHAHDKLILCIEYGPQAGSQCIFLIFNSVEDAQEWEDAMCTLTGEPLTSKNRSKTERKPRRPGIQRNLRKTAPAARGFNTKHCDELHDADSPEQQEHPAESQYTDASRVCGLDVSLIARKSSDDIPDDSRADDNCSLERLPNTNDTDSALPHDDLLCTPVLSLPTSLRSQDDCEIHNNLWILRRERDEQSIGVKYQKEDVLKMGLQLTGHGKCVYITGWINRACNLNIGDCILQVDSNKPVNGSEVQDYITNAAEDSVSMEIQRFPLGTVIMVQIQHNSNIIASHSLGIQLNGSEIVEMDPGGDIRQLCDPGWAWFRESRSNRSITAINDRRVPFDADTEKVEDMLDEAMRDERFLVLQLHPTKFIQELTITENASNESSILHPLKRRGAKLL